MKNVGIICEYNPLHGGHKYQMSRLREMGAERIVCLMSGNAVQRGELAIIPKALRARSAVEAGADAVFELPFPYSAGSAEFFASAGVDICLSKGKFNKEFSLDGNRYKRICVYTCKMKSNRFHSCDAPTGRRIHSGLIL